MQKKLIIDNRMRNIEKTKLKELGYKLLEVKENKNLYPEISSHVDILACKVGEKIVVEPTQYANFQEYENFIKGQEIVLKKYPLDIKYNVCIIGKKAIHNFQNTDSKLKELLINDGYELINTTQGYTNCSIAVIDDNSAIVSDQGLYKILKFHGIEVLLVNNNLDIKLFNGKKEIKDDELKEKIFSFYKLKKKALDSNSDYYFKNKPEKNQKVALLRRSIGEELE